jgi:hypothetical protein
VPEQRVLLGGRALQYTLHCFGEVVKTVVLKGQVFVLEIRDAPVEQVDVAALRLEVFDEAVVWHQIQYVRLEDMRVDNQDRDRIFLLCLGLVAVVFGRTLGPDCLFQRKRGLYVGFLQDEGRTRNVLPEADCLQIV